MIVECCGVTHAVPKVHHGRGTNLNVPTWSIVTFLKALPEGKTVWLELNKKKDKHIHVASRKVIVLKVMFCVTKVLKDMFSSIFGSSL